MKFKKLKKRLNNQLAIAGDQICAHLCQEAASCNEGGALVGVDLECFNLNLVPEVQMQFVLGTCYKLG